MTSTGKILYALHFAAQKHRDQRRKDKQHSPYINHPIAVARLLWEVGGIEEDTTIIAALLHDTIEDTQTTPEEIRALFGEETMSIVQEVTDDKSLPPAVRKRLQVEHAPHLSAQAKAIKLADKISNLHDLLDSPPVNWSAARQQEYLLWTEEVVNGLRGTNPALEAQYDKILQDGKKSLGM
jgi:guanosine-3',5'-bis(diphosphate) 3'-pyrophosphohydrolase